MGLRDIVTGELIISPYVEIVHEQPIDKDRLVAYKKAQINTSTLGILGQGEIVPPLDEERFINYGRDFYHIYAVIGEPDWENPTVIDSLLRPRASVFLGFLEREFVDENFPKLKEYFIGRNLLTKS